MIPEKQYPQARTALIIGRGGDVWEEVKQAQLLTEFDTILVVGSTGVDCPLPCQHRVTFHAELFEPWTLKRRENGYPEIPNYWASTYMGGLRRVTRSRIAYDTIFSEGGSSGMIAVQVARERLGAQKIVLAGVPMTIEGGQYDTGRLWAEALAYRDVWERKRDYLKTFVRSLSGWTREQFGEPTLEWLHAEG